jgi:hypothetical protein
MSIKTAKFGQERGADVPLASLQALLRSVFGVLALAEWVLLRVCLPFGKGGV